MPPQAPAPYHPVRPSDSTIRTVRGLRYHLRSWGAPELATPERPALVLLHGWMDVSASFQFLVDALQTTSAAGRYVVAPDWRGFGLTESTASDSYWFPDYLADLEAILDALLPGQPVDLLGHSMGGNVAMIYAGVRPTRIGRLVNLEGFGMPDSRADEAPRRLAQWLDEMRQPPELRGYDSLDAVARRLRQNNPLLREDFAAWLAQHWSRQGPDGRWHLLADAAHKRVNPVLYRKEEVLASWRRISAPLLWVEGDRTDVAKWWGHRYPREDFEARLAVVPRVERRRLAPAGHMLHHDQPEALAGCLADFLARA
ncbi:alpha/beta fold hydrolase [Caldimonas tepidiphila]|uniref:alpha/beta fold hydrolase n=1 Tax=Caldimonas tepidiphila TaxID=2315841 RepID=UPI000E5A1E34|nr:alpha/beta hydrolase [Caldimonas tepidiphila]